MDEALSIEINEANSGKTDLQIKDSENENELDELNEQIRVLQNKNRDLESYISVLNEAKIRLENQKRDIQQSFESQKTSLETEVKRLKYDLNKFTSPPLILGSVIKVLSNDYVAVETGIGQRYVVTKSTDLDSSDLIPGTNVGLSERNYAVSAIYPTMESAEVVSMGMIETTDTTYDKIGGLDKQLKEIREIVELPLLEPEIFKKVGIEPPKGALLYGPPGTGKTLIVKAVANHTNATFLRVSGSELVQKYIGEGAKMVHELFESAKQNQPSIIFIDEIDAIASKRLDDTTGGDREVHRTLMQLLTEMDGFTPLSGVIVIGATNRIDVLDPAILRPGRFDRLLYIPLPNNEGRKEILKIHTEKMNLDPKVDLEEIARNSEGTSGADLKSIATEAGMFAIREKRTTVTQKDFMKAAKKVMFKGDYNIQ
ncbi:MAG: proteasome-activating nucleotidase [Methanosarcinaceae archaeon]|nr:proteasome-activating nucleotidase [Methanosarcinaceae archaeon]